MFTLLSLKLFRFRNHRKLEVHFSKGLTGIVGENGQGKSSIIEGLSFALFGASVLTTPKEQIITLGEISGYVELSFELNGIVGTVTRHLDGNKVVLVYDKILLKKSTEIDDFWFDNLKINSSLYSKVVLAKQGEIPILFSGDPSIKEKIFQKIFLVPNTQKAANTVWKDYLKKVPPLLPTGDLVELNRSKEGLTNTFNIIKDRLDKLNTGDPEAHSKIRAQLVKVETLIASYPKYVESKNDMDKHEQNSIRIDGEIKTVESKLQEYKLESVEDKIKVLNIQIHEYNKRKAIEDKLDNKRLECPGYLTQQSALAYKVNELKGSVIKAQTSLEGSYKELNDVREKLKRVESLNPDECCPMCQQPLLKIEDLVSHLKSEEDRLAKWIDHGEKHCEEDQESLAKYQLEYDKIAKQCKEISRLHEEMNAIEDHSELIFEKLELLEGIQKSIKDNERIKDNLCVEFHMERRALEQCKEVVENSIFNNVTIDEVTQRKEELKVEEDKLYAELSKKASVETEYRGIKSQLEDVERQLALYRVNEAKNLDIEAYKKDLEEVYEALQASQFPRLLISSYSELVNDELQKQVAEFDFPYTVELNHNFGIDVKDHEGRILPNVSGGQIMVIGIALRLTLHAIFSHSFPTLIIDEGSQNLDTQNRSMYFQMLEKLKTTVNKQIIVIDHHEDLKEVADSVIEL